MVNGKFGLFGAIHSASECRIRPSPVELSGLGLFVRENRGLLASFHVPSLIYIYIYISPLLVLKGIDFGRQASAEQKPCLLSIRGSEVWHHGLDACCPQDLPGRASGGEKAEW